jgi:hypothetical protein
MMKPLPHPRSAVSRSGCVSWSAYSDRKTMEVEIPKEALDLWPLSGHRRKRALTLMFPAAPDLLGNDPAIMKVSLRLTGSLTVSLYMAQQFTTDQRQPRCCGGKFGPRRVRGAQPTKPIMNVARARVPAAHPT